VVPVGLRNSFKGLKVCLGCRNVDLNPHHEGQDHLLLICQNMDCQTTESKNETNVWKNLIRLYFSLEVTKKAPNAGRLACSPVICNVFCVRLGMLRQIRWYNIQLAILQATTGLEWFRMEYNVVLRSPFVLPARTLLR
jgi:hypothetical protein